jgi:SAM-dependent methyltransferase
MVALAHAAWHDACTGKLEREAMARYEVQDIMGTTFVAGQFDAVICNRLFHHFIEPEVRRAALTELRRICSGPIVVSFFNSCSIEAVRLAFLRLAFHRFRRDRIPISVGQFAADAQAAGLIFDRIEFTRWGISPQCYAVFRAAPAPSAGIRSCTGLLAA